MMLAKQTERQTRKAIIVALVMISCAFLGGCQMVVTTPVPTVGNTPTVVPTPPGQPAPPATVTITPTPTPEYPFAWQELIPGQTKRTEVLARLGEPNTVKRYQDIESWHYFPYEDSPSNFLRIILQGDIVQLITIDVSGEGVKSVHDYLADLGTPDKEITFDGTHYKATTYVYAQRGFSFTGWGSDVIFKQVYMPTTLQGYLNGWGRFYPEDDPFPTKFPSRLDEVQIVPGKTTKSQVRELLGSPDRKGVSWKYGYPLGYEKTGSDLEYYIYRVSGA